MERTPQQIGSRGVVTVVPVTSYVAHIQLFQVTLPAGQTGLGLDSKAQAEQVRPIEVERLGPESDI